ncbi:MAG: sel1 repeat family protein [Nitrospira sp.]|nr:sel1 repeat family protein [Nitrospira sp.]
MTNAKTIIFVALYVSMIGGLCHVRAQMQWPVNPQAAEDYAADSQKAEDGDAEAAYRLGKTLESGRLGGLKDLKKALEFYRLAAQEGHHQAAERVVKIEAELSQSQEKQEASLPSLGY